MLSGLAGFMLLGMRGEAQACGGLFCNAPPPNPFTPLPVAQNGENIVFSITPDAAGGAPTLQAHIQILYTGDAAKFSWVVPVDAAPTLTTGTDRLFSSSPASRSRVSRRAPRPAGTCIPTRVARHGRARRILVAPARRDGRRRRRPAAACTVSFQGAVGPFDAAVIKSDDPVALQACG